MAGTVPWILVGWIPLMAYLAWRSLPWKRTALSVVVAVQGLFSVLTPTCGCMA